MTRDLRLMLPTNWEPELLSRAAPFRPSYFYGSLPDDPTLRSSLHLPSVSAESIVEFVEDARAQGIKFIYVMNATCLGNREMSEAGRWEILQRCEWLQEIGAAGVVTANPLVMEMVKTSFPRLELHVSVLAHVDQPRKAAFFRNMGADVIHLDPVVNRDFRRLRSIRNAVDCRLSVLVNEGCLLDCPLRAYHANVQSHSAASIAGHYHVDYCYYRCNLQKSTDPAEFIRIPWVRPEDIGAYEDEGVDMFKVAGREKMGGDGPGSHTDWIIRVAESYVNGVSDDLAELLVAVENVRPLSGASPSPWRVRIDSRKLEGFIDYFKAGHCDLDCTRCHYCEHWAKRAIELSGERDGYTRQLETSLAAVRIGSYWTGKAR